MPVITQGGLGAPVDCGANGATVKNGGPSPVFYQDEYPVSASVNDGTLTNGSSVSLAGTQYFFVASGSAAITVTPIPPTSGGGGGGGGGAEPATVIDLGGNLGATKTVATTGATDVIASGGILNANNVLTLTGLVASRAARVTLIGKQDATGSRTLTVTDGTTSTAATIATAANSDFVVLVVWDGATMRVANQPVVAGSAGADAGTTINIVSKTANFTVASADAGKRYNVSSVGAVVVTIPTNASDAIPVGSVFEVVRRGAGGVSVAGTGTASVTGSTTTFADGQVVNSVFAYLDLAEQFSTVAVVKVGTNEWDIIGDVK